MKLELRKYWPCIFALLVFPIPLLLFFRYPGSFWVTGDYQPLGLADALNMAYRLRDLQFYSARGMMDHPGVPFYFMNWLALALTGYPAARGPGFFDAVIEHVDDFYRLTVWLAALTGAVGVYVFARAARNLVPTGVVAVALLVWLVSTPASLLTIVAPSNETFAMLINALFFAALIRLAFDSNFTSDATILAACVGAFAYLNKLSYIYVPVALLAAGVANLAFRKVDRQRARQLTYLAVGSFILAVVAVGILIIGWGGFRVLINFHKNVFLGSGMYGGGPRIVVSGDEVRHALTAIVAERAYAIVIALIGGAGLAVAGYLTARKNPERIPVALIAIGAGIASLLSALFVLKHYSLHYTAGVSATLPASTIACYLLLKSWQWNRRLRIAAAAGVVLLAVLLATALIGGALIPTLAARTNASADAKADLQDIKTRLPEIKGAVEFGYRTPFPWYGEGFVVYYASIPRLTDEYAGNGQQMFSSMMAGPTDRKVGAYVIDKAYFPTVESIKAASDVMLIGPKPVAFRDGDKLIELRTVFLLIPG